MRWWGTLVLLFVLAAPRVEAADADARVVLVMLGGGVRADEMADAERMPWLARAPVRLALEGVASRPHSGAIEMLTGTAGEGAEGGHPRPASPTLMERARRALGLEAQAVWFVSFEGGDALHLAWSTDPTLGASAAPSVCEGDGAFASPLAPLLETLGRPLPTPDAEWTLLRDLRRLGERALGARRPEGVDAPDAESERVERALLAEIDRRAALAAGPVPRDERALRAAATVLAVHRPRLVVVRLGDAALAQGDDARRAALGALDASLAALDAFVRADPVLARATAILVVGEPSRGGGATDAGAGALGLAAVGGRVERAGRGRGRLVDVAPTVLALLGAGGASPGTGRPLLRPIR